MMSRFLVINAAVFIALPVFAQSVLELPLDADNCAIHTALSPETSGQCQKTRQGIGRGIVLRIDAALNQADPVTPPNTGSFQPLRPIAPTIRVAAATPEKPRTTHSGISRAAAPSGDGYFIQFAFDSAVLEPRFKGHLDQLSQVLKVKAMADNCLKIIGHTDTVGSAAYNLRLSGRRAKAVADYLLVEGQIPANRLSTKAEGENRPLPDVDGTDALNRRVEFTTKKGVNGC